MTDDLGLGSGELTAPDFEGALAHEIAESERLERERQDLKARVRHSQKLESLGVLAGAIAHDFNNYLTGILGNAGMVLRRLPDDSSCRSLVEEIEKAAHQAAALSNQMLAYSGRRPGSARALDLGELIEEMAPLLRISISKKAALRVDTGCELPCIEGDPGQIRQVIMNLVTNASEALDAGVGHIAISAGVLEADRAYLDELDLGGVELSEGPYVYLEVSDTGEGIEEPAQGLLYDPTFTTKSPGRGLGLAAVQGIVRDHGGAIRVDSEPGRGSTFKILFTASDLIVRQQSVTAPVADFTDSKPRDLDEVETILVVDDEEIIRDVAQSILEEFGYEVLIARDGLEALEVYEENAGTISGVLLDMTMPRLDGAETFRALRQLQPGLRIVLSSGFDNESTVDQMMSQEAVGFIQKPYRPMQLIDKMREVLEG